MTDPDSFHERVRGAAVLLVVFAAALVAVVLAANWLGSRAGSSSGDATPDPSAGPADTGPVVLAISIDGLRPDAITKLGNEGTPNLHRLMKQGASTLNARTAYESTKTLPNHTGMLTGRRVDKDHGGHGVFFNRDDGRTVVKAEVNLYKQIGLYRASKAKSGVIASPSLDGSSGGRPV